MDQDSVLHKIVTQEPAYSRLLFNLIKCCPTFQREFLDLILGPQYATMVNIEQIRPENDIPEYGRPDWDIRSDKLRAFVEIKVDRRRWLTEHQTLTEPETNALNGYAKYLSEQPKDKHKMLVFLVPGDWPTDRLKDKFPQLEQSGIELKIVRWENVLSRIVKCEDAHHDVLLEEFRKLLQERFGPMKFDDAERTFLLSKDFTTIYSACFKTNELVEQLKEKVKEKLKDRLQAKIEIVIEPDKPTVDFFGFYLRQKQQQKNRLLWVGVCPEYGSPISFGVGGDDQCFSSEAFTAGWQGPTKQCNGYKLAELPETLFQSDDLVKAVWEKLAPVMDRIIAAA